MTTEIGPEQEEILEALSTVRAELAEVRSEEAEVKQERQDLVIAGFAKDIPAQKLAESSGLSLPRIYQIRNQQGEKQATVA